VIPGLEPGPFTPWDDAQIASSKVCAMGTFVKPVSIQLTISQ